MSRAVGILSESLCVEDCLKVRRAHLSDLPPILDIEQQSFASPWSKETLLDEIRGKEWSRTLVATRAGQPVGFMIYWMVVSEIHLLNLAVHPDARRKKVATTLILHLVELADNGNVTEVFLEVRDSNHAAQSLYRGFGFKPVGVRKRYYADNGEDAIVMCLRRT